MVIWLLGVKSSFYLVTIGILKLDVSTLRNILKAWLRKLIHHPNTLVILHLNYYVIV
jgi:hypothetical protein